MHGSSPAQAVHLIDENDAWGILPCQPEQLTDKLLTLTQPLGDEVTAADAEEGTISFGCNGLQYACKSTEVIETLLQLHCMTQL